MKKTMLVLTSLLVLSAVSACGGEPARAPETDARSGETDAGTEAETADPYDPGLPELSFGGADFRVLHYDATFERYKFAVKEEIGEAINDACWRRDRQTEDRFDVRISEAAGSGGTVQADLKAAVMAGDAVYDVVLPHFIDNYSGMITSGLLTNLYDVPYLDLSQPWWYPGALENMTVHGRVYYTSSYYSVTCQNFFCLLYNKKLLDSLGLASPSDTVFDGTWTLDKMQGMMAEAAADLDGDGKMTEADRFGLVTCEDIMYPFLVAFDQCSVGKDEAGDLRLVLNCPRTAEIVDRMNGLVNGNDVYFGVYPDQYITRDFGGGHALFAFIGLGTYYQIVRGIDAFDYGILPLPKFDESQADYHVLRADSFIGVPSVLENPEKTGAVLEALCAASMKYVYPAFKDQVLYAKCLRDETSARVMDLMYTSFSYDVGLTLCANRNLARILDNCKKGKELGFASFYTRNEKAVAGQLDTLNEYIRGDDNS